jgi:hypothetical protein
MNMAEQLQEEGKIILASVFKDVRPSLQKEHCG